MTQKAVIFDLDGTLIDSLEDLANSVNQTLSEFGFNTHEIDAYKYFIGDGVKVLLKKATDYKVNDEIIAELHERFKVIYKKEIDSRTTVYEGIYQLLEKLEKTSYPKAILSNKPHNFTLDCMDKFFCDFTFVNISGQKNEIAKKPDAQAALIIADEFKKDVKDIYFVGDTKIDMQTAKNAGMIAIGVLWGFRDEKELKDNGADFIVKNTQELYDILISNPYIPIACHFYDELESAAVKKIKSTIVYIEDSDIKTIENYIVDFKIIDKKEYAILKNEMKIRLDEIISFNGLKASTYKCNV